MRALVDTMRDPQRIVNYDRDVQVWLWFREGSMAPLAAVAPAAAVLNSCMHATHPLLLSS